MEHLLKIVYAPNSIYQRNKRGWCGSVDTARDDIEILLNKNAGAARDKDKALAIAFKYGLRKFKRDCDDFGPVDWSDVCPWTIDQVLEPDFFPSLEDG